MLNILKKTKYCGVICETNGKVFKTIVEAARYAGCDDWTMSLKMTAKGQFVDSLGRVYKRLRPMDTKKKYTSCSDKMVKKVRKKSTIKNKKQQTFISIDEALKTPNTVPLNNHKKIKVPDIVKEAIKEKIINLLKQHGIYEQFMELIEVIGYESIKE